ncbi:hypothetical protein [Nocardia brasiliensis]|uniref:hypothetical protein n=1 Tax=Nocardia brasiliensis TaxID=37326 RepID=UPI003D8B2182
MEYRIAKILLATTLTTVGLSISMAAPAAAAPPGCTVSESGNTVTAYCYSSASGTQFRAVARCRYLTPSGSYDYNVFYGPWKRQGDFASSEAACGLGWNLREPNAQTR